MFTRMIWKHSCQQAAIALLLAASPVLAIEIEGFTEPYRDLDVAATETGIVAKIHIKEGDTVHKDQVLGNLDEAVLRATLEIADRHRQAQGRLKSAQADVRLKSERAEKLKLLFDRQHASQEEIDRTLVEKDVAEAQLLAVEEEIAVRQLEFDRIQVQLEQRQVRSPIDGVVVKVHRDVGEFVSLNDPVVVTVVQLDPLIATHSVPSSLCREITLNSTVNIQVGDKYTPVKGTVEYIAPVTDAQSGTVQIKIRVPNPDRLHRSGEKCQLILPGDAPQAETVNQRVKGSKPASTLSPAPKTSQIELRKN